MSILAAALRPWTTLFGREPEEELEHAQQETLLETPEPSPSLEPDDEVYPVHYFDDTLINRSMIMCWTMKFDEVLDPEALHTALARVLEIGDWRKLGGRLKLNVK